MGIVTQDESPPLERSLGTVMLLLEGLEHGSKHFAGSGYCMLYGKGCIGFSIKLS